MIRFPLKLSHFQILAKEYIHRYGTSIERIRSQVVYLYYELIRQLLDKKESHFKCFPGGSGVFMAGPGEKNIDFYIFTIDGVKFELNYQIYASLPSPHILITAYTETPRVPLSADMRKELDIVCKEFTQITPQDVIMALALEDTPSTVYCADSD